ncbi:hypothetical protein CHU95_02245 [Niveispirillum lacus]|uniref:Sulfotransferase domain-containing protein n=2 Tax=Niveispirillum lacus TaxID=1981099 RepID=A0A255Z6X8_9PROT|nr:hypothetical protein CHU95_02245 [Niveispirillum lacus]
MQSSGATAFTQMLAQRPGCVALVDIPNNFAAPRVTTRLDFVAKAVVTTAYPLATHVERFRPDAVILFLRDPRVNHVSLRTKDYRHRSGLMEEKFLILDQLFAERHRFDAVVHYEDFVLGDPSVGKALADLGWPVEDGYREFRRSYDELLASLWAAEPDLRDRMDVVFGNAKGRAVSQAPIKKDWDRAVEAAVAHLCPRLLAHYQQRDAAAAEPAPKAPAAGAVTAPP